LLRCIRLPRIAPVMNDPFEDLATLQVVCVACCTHVTTRLAAVRGLTNDHGWLQQ
jgi:hypothetical protein